jgi:hypothetical protein
MSASSRTVIVRGVPNECLFVSSGLAAGLPRGRVWPSSRGTSRSFVLGSLRALHLDLRLRQAAGSQLSRNAQVRPGHEAAGQLPGTGLAGAVVVWWQGPGVACPKSRFLGCNPAALAAEPFPCCPPGSFSRAAVWRESACRREHGVADLPFKRSHRPPGRARLHPYHRDRLPPRTTTRDHNRRRNHGPTLQSNPNPAHNGCRPTEQVGHHGMRPIVGHEQSRTPITRTRGGVTVGKLMAHR